MYINNSDEVSMLVNDASPCLLGNNHAQGVAAINHARGVTARTFCSECHSLKRVCSLRRTKMIELCCMQTKRSRLSWNRPTVQSSMFAVLQN